MNVLLITITSISDVETQHLYVDLLKVFAAHGHEAYALVAANSAEEELQHFDKNGLHIVRVNTGHITRSGVIRKGIATLMAPVKYGRALNKFFGGIRFDLVINTTPPTTFYRLVNSLRRRHEAFSYLLLKDIFPQDAVDLGALSKDGIRGIAYRYFRYTEIQTYQSADYIGCMSQGNVDYLLDHEPYLDPTRVEINPNSIIPKLMPAVDRVVERERYGIPADEFVFVYGGNLGYAQDIRFLTACIRENERKPFGHIVVAGSGVERWLLEKLVDEECPNHFTLLPLLSHDDFDGLLYASDAAIVLLDKRFTIPNVPSRCLSYMQAGLPMVFATDSHCDFATTAVDNGFAVKCISDRPSSFADACERIKRKKHKRMGRLARKYLEEQCSCEVSYKTIMEHVNEQ